DSFRRSLGLRVLLLPIERLLQLLRADRSHDREHLAQPARVPAGLVETLSLERFGQLLVRDDARVDELLAEGLHGRRLAEDAAAGRGGQGRPSGRASPPRRWSSPVSTGLSGPCRV